MWLLIYLVLLVGVRVVGELLHVGEPRAELVLQHALVCQRVDAALERRHLLRRLETLALALQQLGASRLLCTC